MLSSWSCRGGSSCSPSRAVGSSSWPRNTGKHDTVLHSKIQIILTHLSRVANDSRPGRLVDSKIMVELKIMGVMLCHGHAAVVD